VEGDVFLAVGDGALGQERLLSGAYCPLDVEKARSRRAVMFAVGQAGECAHCLERDRVGDAGQEQGGGEQGEEAVGLVAPAVARLREVLEAAQDEEALAAGVGDDGRQVGERGDAGHLVEGPQHRPPLVGDEGVLAYLVEEGADGRRVLLRLGAGDDDVDGVPAGREGGEVEGDRHTPEVDPVAETIRWLGTSRAQAFAIEQLEKEPSLTRVGDGDRRMALIEPEPWMIEAVGPPPLAGPEREHWARDVGRIAAYRDIYQITDPTDALGPEPTDPDQRRSWALARMTVIEHQRAMELEKGLTL
jgi:hypothetical protein